MDGIYPSHWRKAFGHVRVRIRSSARFRVDLTKLAGPWIWVKLNGVCHGIARFSGPGDEDGMQCADADIHVPVQSFREVIVLETYTSDGIKKLILGRIGILVRELACSASSSISRLQHYAIQESEGQLSVEYNLEFSHSEKKLDFGEFERYGQSFRPVLMLPTIPEDDSDAEIPATPHEVENFIAAPRSNLNDLGPVSWRVTAPIPKSRTDSESVCSVSSGATTFVTARTHISADYISVPGGSRDFYHPQAF
ncbi:hypothetical protein FRC05_000387 [Tulasnella sp. 425]|nr:hypothetical protein FRC05_000387 [Tulasnella sp. 425]